MINISRYGSNLYSEKLNMQENFLYHHNDHFHTMFTKFLNINFIYFAYNSNITCTPLHSAVYV